jgi:carbamoyl-phosphate synthase large subunit
LIGTETEVDAVCDGTEILIPGIMEHVERKGIHSGDSIRYTPPLTSPRRRRRRSPDYSARLAKGANVIGLINIQFIAKGDDVLRDRG